MQKHTSCWWQVLDGEMACPPEDSNGLDGMGNPPYQEFLDKVLAAKAKTSDAARRKYRKLCASAAGLNYKDRYGDGLAAIWIKRFLPARRNALPGQPLT